MLAAHLGQQYAVFRRHANPALLLENAAPQDLLDGYGVVDQRGAWLVRCAVECCLTPPFDHKLAVARKSDVRDDRRRLQEALRIFLQPLDRTELDLGFAGTRYIGIGGIEGPICERRAAVPECQGGQERVPHRSGSNLPYQASDPLIMNRRFAPSRSTW